MPDGVRDDDPTLVTTGSRILVSVLERLQLLPVTVLEDRGADLQRHPQKSYGHRTVAIGSAARSGSAIGNFYRK